MAYLIYLRVSTETQADSGNGLAAQVDACKRFIKANDGELFGIYSDEGISGSKGLEKRPSLMTAIDHLNKGDALIVAKRDRLGRDPIIVAMIEAAANRKGASIISAAGEGNGDDPASILMRRLIDSFAEYERLIIGARTKAALQAKKRKGERTGSIPYGFTLDQDGKTLRPVKKEQAVIDQVKHLKGKGYSLRKIAGILAGKGCMSRDGKVFHPNQIKRILDFTLPGVA